MLKTREKPILFNTQMVQAILGGRKTQTRRPFKNQPILKEGAWHWKDCQWIDGGIGFPDSGIEDYAPYQIGDILWVQETFCELPYEQEHVPINGGWITIPKYAYKADSEIDYTGIWKPSIHMPRVAARLFLKITDVRVERLWDITDEGCIKEGIKYVRVPEPANCREELQSRIDCGIATIEKFADLWDSLNTKRGYGWKTNPWVWVIGFERLEDY